MLFSSVFPLTLTSELKRKKKAIVTECGFPSSPFFSACLRAELRGKSYLNVFMSS